MHRAFAGWLIGKPWRAFLLTAIFGVLSPQGLSPLSVVAGAIPVLLLLSRDARFGLQAALGGSVAVSAVLLASRQSVLESLASVALLFLAPIGLAMLLQRTGSLRWCFQIAVLAAGLLLVGIYVGVDAPVALWRQLLLAAVQEVTQSGLIADDQTVLQSLAHTNWGTYVALWLVTVFGALSLGSWWQSLIKSPGAFGREFQQLRLGAVLGLLSVLSVCAAFAFDKLNVDAPLVDALVWVATVALACQGLSAVHRLKASGRVGRGWLTATYVLLILPLTMLFVVMLLAGWGVADNWRRRA